MRKAYIVRLTTYHTIEHLIQNFFKGAVVLSYSRVWVFA